MTRTRNLGVTGPEVMPINVANDDNPMGQGGQVGAPHFTEEDTEAQAHHQHAPEAGTCPISPDSCPELSAKPWALGAPYSPPPLCPQPRPSGHAEIRSWEAPRWGPWPTHLGAPLWTVTLRGLAQRRSSGNSSRNMAAVSRVGTVGQALSSCPHFRRGDTEAPETWWHLVMASAWLTAGPRLGSVSV